MLDFVRNGSLGRGATVSRPAQPTVNTSPIVGEPSGQKPAVHVRDVTNGYDLYTLNADAVNHYPASCVKLMTCLIAYETKSAVWSSETVTVTAADVTQPYAGLTVSFAGLQANDVVTWEGLAYGAMLPSGGDCCKAIARTLGHAAYLAAGSTGNDGEARFVDMMNARAAQLGMTNTTFFDPFGGSESPGPPVVTRNLMSARDLTTICNAAMGVSALRAIARTVSFGITVTGANARTLTVTHVDAFINGPFFNAAGVRNTNALGGKTGTWVVDTASIFKYNLSMVWQTPAGYEIVITTLGSIGDWPRHLDQQGLYCQALKDFAYLTDGTSVGSDASIASVKLLAGFDGSIADESSAARTLTNSTAALGTGFLQGSSGAILFDSAADNISAADAADLVIGSGDFTAECWYVSDGTNTNAEYVWLIKTGSGQREFAWNYLAGGFNLFASSDGANWTSAVAYTILQADRPTFFNGAPRHLALVKSGSTWSLWINGEKCPTTISVGTVFNGTGALTIGINGSSPLGRIDEVRITYGVARYTGSMVTFSPRKFPRS
jgi:D-alanyl-D-alanine carboxypeptidase (penicillin-binding protein 5/6)